MAIVLRPVLISIMILLGLTANLSAAPGDEFWSSEFSPRGTNGEVRASVEFNGNLIVGGDFTTAGAVAAERVALWNGTMWSALGDGFNGTVEVLFEWNANLYAGGMFTASGAAPVNYLARWTGAEWVEVGGGTDSPVLSFADFGGQLVVGGWFTSVGTGGGQINVEGVAGWDGASWHDLGADFDGEGSVNDLQVYSGSLYVCGYFVFASGIETPHIVRFNGTSWLGVGNGVTDDSDFEPDPYSAEVLDMEVHGGNLILNGFFNATGTGQSADGIVAWNGANWVSMGSPTGFGFLDTMGRANGSLYIIGSANFLFQYAGNGNWNFVSQGASGVPAIVSMLSEYAGDLLIGGAFLRFGNRDVDNIARYDGQPQALGTGNGLEDYAWRLVPWNGMLVAGGRFQNAAGTDATNKIAAWDGTTWNSLGVGATLPFNAAIQSVVVYQGDLIVGGGFTSIAGVVASHVARYDGTNWHPMDNGSLGTVTELVVWNDELYGRITLSPGVPTISRWSGSTWEIIGDEVFGGDIYNMLDYNGDLIIVGQATSLEGQLINGAARWNGVDWAPLGTGIAGAPGARIWNAVVYDGLLVAAGTFNTAGGVPAAGLAAWDGDSWSEFGGGSDGFCYAVCLFNGELYVTGNFTTIGGVPASGIARWDGANWQAMGSGLTGYGNQLGEYGGRLFVSGDFRHAGGQSASFITSWSPGTVSAAPETRITTGPSASPNPFGRSTSVFFELPQARNMHIDVFDIRGRRVASLHRGQMQAGPNQVIWNGRDARGRRQPTGTYFIRARGGESSFTAKINLIR